MNSKKPEEDKVPGAGDPRNPDYPNLVAWEGATSILVSHDGIMDDDLLDILMEESEKSKSGD